MIGMKLTTSIYVEKMPRPISSDILALVGWQETEE
jgi:hypothetical protein